MSVRWTNTAQEHLDAIYDYIANNSPEYAIRMVDRLTKRSQQIENAPFSGRCVPEYNLNQIREVIEPPYRIIYHIISQHIDIIAVIHCARNVLLEK